MTFFISKPKPYNPFESDEDDDEEDDWEDDEMFDYE